MAFGILSFCTFLQRHGSSALPVGMPVSTVNGLVDGKAVSGSELTGVITGLLGTEVVEHGWQIDGTLVPGANQASFTPAIGVNASDNSAIAYSPKINGVTVLSIWKSVVRPVPVFSIQPSIIGDLVAGAILQIDPGVASGALTIEELTLNGIDRTGTLIGMAFDTAGANAGDIRLRIRATNSGGTVLSDLIIVTLAPASVVVSLPRISGVQRMGQTLTVATGSLSGVSAYQWFADDMAMPGATAASLTAPMAGVLTCLVSCNEGQLLTPGFKIIHSHDAGHGLMDDAIMALVPHADATHVAVANGSWSEPATWDVGTVPGPGAVVLVPRGRDVTYDVPQAVAPRLDRVRVDGILRWALDRSTHMLTELLYGHFDSKMLIGTGFGAAMPNQYKAKIVISDRDYRTSPNAPSDINLATDPTLIGRGVLHHGEWTMFGAVITPFLKTASGQAPMAGATSLTLSAAPTNWAVGDKIVIPGTVFESKNGQTTRYDEERVITAISGATVSWSGPLLHNHDHHAPTVTRTDLQPNIENTKRNITITSESAAPIHRRGHTMAVHGTATPDYWSAEFLELGRTDKQRPSGVIANGQFKSYDAIAKGLVLTPLTAAANVQSRYPAHFHFLGFHQAKRPHIQDCRIEGAPGWALVHHGCEADMFFNTVYRYAGAGIVGETSDEIGAWVGNLVYGCESTYAKHGYIKSQEGKDGLFGDTGRTGHGYFMRGRAMRVNGNFAHGVNIGYVFYHRGNPASNNLAPHIEALRVNLDIKDLSLLDRNYPDSIPRSKYPIIHFADNEVGGCATGMSVVKANSINDHDLNINLKRLKAWGARIGAATEYIGSYALTEFDVVGTSFVPPSGKYPLANQGFYLVAVEQLAYVRCKVENFAIGNHLFSYSVNGIDSDDFSQGDPRFILVDMQYTNVATPQEYRTAGTPVKTAQDVTRFFNPQNPITYVDRVSHDLPFIMFDWNGNHTVAPTNLQSGFKTDSVGNLGALPKTWDPAGLRAKGTDCRNYLAKWGYWVYNGQNICIFPDYISDRVTTTPIRQVFAFRLTGSVSGHVNNGPFVRSPSRPVQADKSLTTTAGTPLTFNALAGATVAAGRTAKLEQSYYNSDHGLTVVDPAAGTVTYRPDPRYTSAKYGRPDELLLFIGDGGDLFNTTRVNITVT
jgi:hypothetical protein